ncbi:TPA: hypothetical protein ACTXXA_002129 [Legionella anisa]
MPKNAELLSAIRDLKSRNKVDREKALDAILKVDHTDAPAFRKAVVDNGTFWQGSPGNIMTVPTRGTWTTWFSRGYVGTEKQVTGYLESDQFLDPVSFQELKQAAAEERVKLSLENVDQNVLINILKHNGEDCRKYLAEKLAPAGVKLSEVQGWDPANDNVLNVNALKRIKTEAANLLLLQLIKKPELKDLKVFQDLLDAHRSGVVGDIQKAGKELAKKAGIDPASLDDFANALTLNLTPDILREAGVRRDALQKDAQIEEFKQKLKDYESGLTLDVLVGKGALLNRDEGGFRTELYSARELPAGPYNNGTTQADPDIQNLVKEMHKRLCAKYVEEKLKRYPNINPGDPGALPPVASVNVTEMAAVLKENRQLQLKAAIQHFIPGEDNIYAQAGLDDPAKTSLFKAALVKNYVNKLHGASNEVLLKKLAKPETDIKEIRRELATKIGNGITHEHLECLQESDLKDIKKSARLEVFKLLVGEAHPKLVDAFSSLPDTKQQELIDPANRAKLSFILKAQTKEVLKRYLGNDVSGKDDYLAGIVAENKSNTFFKQINNTEIAKMLAGYKPAITDMDPAKVKAINDELFARRGSDLAQLVDYKAVIDVLFTQSGIANTVPNRTNFYAAFNLNHDGSAFTTLPQGIPTTNTVTDRVKRDHGFNLNLHNKLHAVATTPVPPPHSGYEKLLNVLLKVEKTAQFNPDHTTADDIRDIFYKGPTLEEVLADPKMATIRDKLKEQLSSDEYNALRKELRDNKAASTDPADTHQIGEDIKASGKAYKKVDERREALQERLNDIAVIVRISTSHGKKAPEFVGQSQEELRNSIDGYKALQKECLNTIIYLEHASKALEASRPAIPAQLAHPPCTKAQVSDREKLIKEASQLDLKIQSELTQVKSLLTKYQTAYKVTTEEILPALEKAYKGSDRELYQAEEITISRRSRKDALNMGHKAEDKDVLFKPEYDPHTGVLVEQDEESVFKTTGKPAPDEVICFDTHKEATIVVPQPGNPRAGMNKDVVIEGRFTYDPSPKGGISTTMTGSSVTRAMPGRYEVVQPPTPKDDPQGKLKAKEIVDEKVDFYMKMATQILSNIKQPLSKPIKLKGVRGKEDEAEYLWTALVVLGEKINISPDQIRVVGTSNFDPEKQRDKRAIIGTDKGFSKTSTYNTVFKSREASINGHVQKLEERLKEKKTQAEKTEEVSSSLQSTMKQRFKTGREIEQEAQKIKDEQGMTQEVARVTTNNTLSS